VCNAASQILPVGANRRERVEDSLHESFKVVALTVREPLLGQLPDSLVRIELRCIRGKALQMEALTARAELPNEQAAVRIATVPQHEDVAAQVAEQLAQEVPCLQLPDIVGVQLEVETQTPPAGRHRDPRNRGNAVSPIEMMDGRSLADGSPGAGDGRCQLESRFVDEDEVGTQPSGVFFTAGQSRRRKRRISSWLRSRAFFCGFWWLQPSECRSLPTWSRW
jgi:hypothetical protein